MASLVQSFAFARRIPQTPSIGSTTVTNPDHVHLSFGFAAPDLFPIERLEQAASEAITLYGQKALQYSGSGGPAKIIGWIRNRSLQHGIHADADQVLVTYGSTQGIALAANVLLDPGDHVWVESPSFFSALQAFRVAEAKITSFPIDADGVRVALLEEALKEAKRTGKPIPKLFYTMPTYHNPGGVTLSLDRRRRLAELAKEYHFFILEDDAYAELNFTGDELPPLYTLCPDRVIYLNTFSKIIAPGIRLGWVIADQAIISKLKLLMLGGSTGVFTQEILAQLLEGFPFEEHLEQLRGHYRKQRDVMVAALQRHFGEHVTFHIPQGGFFLWLTFREDVNTARLLRHAEARGVSFVDGRSFYVQEEGFRHARLCFSYCSQEQIERGIRILADAYFDYLNGNVQ